jgi:hypothetical protein
MAVSCDNYVEYLNTLYGQNVDLVIESACITAQKGIK